MAAEMIKAGRKTLPASVVEPLILEVWRGRRQLMTLCRKLSEAIHTAGTEALDITLADVPTRRRK